MSTTAAETQPETLPETQPETQDSPSETETAAGTTRRPGRPRLATIVLSAALAGSLAVTGWLLLERRETAALDRARSEATSQARKAAVALTSYHHETLEEDFDAVRDLAVDPFAGQFDKAGGRLTEVLEKYDGTAQGKVVRAAVSSASADEVEVLLFVDQRVNSALQDKPRVDRNRIAMTMVLTDSGWRVSRAKLL